MRFLAFLVVFALPLQAQQIEVDVELFLAVDVSRSMSPQEIEIQRRGYAEALVSAPVVEAVSSGLLGRVALTYVEWAGDGRERVVVDWRLIGSAEDLTRFAGDLRKRFDPALSRTSISSVLTYARRSFETNQFKGLRRVIDVSGDGPNNQGGRVLAARDAAVAAGITINGLPLVTPKTRLFKWHLADLDRYYINCVIGGAGAFSIPVDRWDQFEAAVRRKLVLEIAGLRPRILPASFVMEGARQDGSYDCLIGEKMWERARRERTRP